MFSEAKISLASLFIEASKFYFLFFLEANVYIGCSGNFSLHFVFCKNIFHSDGETFDHNPALG